MNEKEGIKINSEREWCALHRPGHQKCKIFVIQNVIQYKKKHHQIIREFIKWQYISQCKKHTSRPNALLMVRVHVQRQQVLCDHRRAVVCQLTAQFSIATMPWNSYNGRRCFALEARKILSFQSVEHTNTPIRVVHTCAHCTAAHSHTYANQIIRSAFTHKANKIQRNQKKRNTENPNRKQQRRFWFAIYRIYLFIFLIFLHYVHGVTIYLYFDLTRYAWHGVRAATVTIIAYCSATYINYNRTPVAYMQMKMSAIRRMNDVRTSPSWHLAMAQLTQSLSALKLNSKELLCNTVYLLFCLRYSRTLLQTHVSCVCGLVWRCAHLSIAIAQQPNAQKRTN